MPVATRQRPGRQANSRAANDNEKALPTSSDGSPAETRRSKRLGHVDVEDIRDFEAIRVKRRRRSRRDVEEEEEEAEEAAAAEEEENQGSDGEHGQGEEDEATDDTGESIATPVVPDVPIGQPTAKKRGRPRKTHGNLRVDTLRKEATNTLRTNARRGEEAQTTQDSGRPTTTKATKATKGLAEPSISQSTANLDDEDEPAASAEAGADIYEVPPSPPRGSARAVDRSDLSQEDVEASDSRATSRTSDTGDGLFVEQEVESTDEDEDEEQLYNDPTMVELPPSAQAGEDDAARGDTDSEMEPQSREATEQIRRLVGDMSPSTPGSFPEVDYAYPDDYFIFHKPEDEDRLTAAPIKSHSLKSIKELMHGVGWTRSRDGRAVDLTTGPAQMSQRIQPLWDHIQALNHFWDGAPRAPLFNQQTDYLHSEDVVAVDARLTIKEVDILVHDTAMKAKKPSRGEESDMPPPRFVKELSEKIIPLLVVTLGNVFRKGTEHDKSHYAGRFTKPMLQMMHRVVAWIEKLYYGMLSNLSRRRQKEQLLSKRLSREKLGEYLRGFKLELDETWVKTNQAIQRQRFYEERWLERKRKEELERHEYEETRRRQREFCDRRLEERIAAEKARRQASSPQQSRHERQQAVPVSRYSRTRRGPADAEPSRPWPEADAKWLLQTLTARPNSDSEALATMLKRSEDDVRAMIRLLKESARTHAASRGKEVPAFAAV
ncbi:hypothetical protein CORC01_10440 [Colletotrichum orchidophilum]|uniref:Uncharacterized protein n=1 Tax=Colletotrichum orchidophilum TaxID=1209926 RepID=A0A1G4AYN4_9PEZI|nr:uncharacterized protein CORC01_10440 [Colletotrichum orchidophilum]OHE94280.1 hypothetical protein CORC01_10440 [Colletotrichum orchidophilum]